MTIGIEMWMTWVIAILGMVFSSAGMWAYFSKRFDRTTAVDKLIMGLAHSLITQKGENFIARGYITQEEYADFVKLLAEPYISLGGNGLAKKMMVEIDRMPLRPNDWKPDE